MEYMRNEITFTGENLIEVNSKAYIKTCKLEDEGWIYKDSHLWMDGELYCITSHFIKPKWKEDKSKEDDMSKNYQKNIVNEWVKEIMNIAKLAYGAQSAYKNEYLRQIIGVCETITITLDCCKDSDS